MLVAAHQPLFIPWIGYFDKINKVDIFVIVDNVEFTTSGWIRRNTLKNSQGPTSLFVPVIKKKSNKLIKDVKIDNVGNYRWKQKHFDTYKSNYSKSPYFKEIMPQLLQIYEKKFDFLSEFNIELIKYICLYLRIKTKIVIGSDINVCGHKTDLIVDICQKTGADSFMLGVGGSLVYANRDYIESKGIRIIEQNFKHPVYSQRFGKFVPNMSILDLLFNCGPDSRKILSGEK